MNRWKLAVLVAGGLALLGPSVAEASRVVVLDVEGDRSRELEQTLTSIVRDEHDVISNAAFKRAAKKAKVKGRIGKGIAKVTKKVAAAAIIDGTLTPADDAFVLVVRVRRPNGETVEEVTIGLKEPNLSERARRKLGRQLLVAIDNLGTSPLAAPVREPIIEEEEAPDPVVPAVSGDEKPESLAPAVTAAAAADGDAELPANRPPPPMRAPRVDAGVKATAMVARPRKRPIALRLEVGASGTQRSLAFITRSELQNRPAGFLNNQPVPGAHVEAELYPFAFAGSGFASRIGIGAEYDQVIGATTPVMGVALPTTQALLRVGARLRALGGSTRTSASVTLTGGYGQRVFTVDRSQLPAGAVLDLPDVDYRFFDPGLAFRLPLGSTLALSASARGLLVQQTGAISGPQEYGTSTAFGVDADAGFELVLSRFLIHVSGRYTQINHTFDGNGAQTTGRDADPQTPDVAGAYDRYLVGAATIGVLF